MMYAKDYAEQLSTGKLCLALVPDCYKWSFSEVWKRVDHIMRCNLDLDKDPFGSNKTRYLRIMRMIFETNRYDYLIRNVYHAKLLYQEELGPIMVGGDVEWLSLPKLVHETSPFTSDYCPCCTKKREVVV